MYFDNLFLTHTFLKLYFIIDVLPVTYFLEGSLELEIDVFCLLFTAFHITAWVIGSETLSKDRNYLQRQSR